MVNESRLYLNHNHQHDTDLHPVLIASTGSNFEAVMAGSIPEIRPIILLIMFLKNFPSLKQIQIQYVGQYQL
jgi:hypothetical protein